MRCRLVLIAGLAFWLAAPAAFAQVPLPPGRDSDRQAVAAGQRLFQMNFARPQLHEGEELGAGGNGLGPLFNETSCVACHNQGGVGGGGDRDSNSLLMGVVARPKRPANLPAVVRAASEVHPALGPNSIVVPVHRFAVGHPEEVAAYHEFLEGLWKAFEIDPAFEQVTPVRKRIGPATLELSQRNPAALWGAGTVDRVRLEGGAEFRRRLAREQPTRHPGISGRVPRTLQGGEGWFGWRGQVGSLDQFVRNACSLELGLQVTGFPEDQLPVPVSNPDFRARVEPRLDLTDEQVARLMAFVHSLPRPEPTASHDADRTTIERGERVFSRIGCDHCHVKDFAWVKGLYSDMLLHDMGPQYSDVQIAVPETFVDVVQFNPEGLGYYNMDMSFLTFNEVQSNPEQEWKTPALWGVADSAPYMHDGRAATLDEAIRMHDGEALRAATAYRNLEQADRDLLLAFLGSLKAPASAIPSRSQNLTRQAVAE
ncbi:MAG: hypothetical protein KF774_10470 [Planctomyces sp.]|nr:hypothetical protein [Planctomyces sp.]